MQVGSFSTALYHDGVTFISPAPVPYRAFSSLFRPLEPGAWTLVAAAFVITTLLIFATSYAEDIIVPTACLQHLAGAARAAWYSLATLIKQDVTGTSTSKDAWAVRL